MSRRFVSRENHILAVAVSRLERHGAKLSINIANDGFNRRIGAEGAACDLVGHLSVSIPASA